MPMRVLIVDANDAARASVTTLLDGTGCQVDHAPDGVEAFESILAQSYDLIVCEATLPRLDTPDLLGKLRGRGVKTPVVVHTTVTKAATVCGLMKLGIADYVPKSLPPDMVRQKIVSHLSSPEPAPVVASGPVAASGAVPVPGAPSAAISGAHAAANGTAAGHGVLMVEAPEADQQRLRALLPAGLGFDACKTFNDGLAKARHGHYKMTVVDTDADLLNLGGLVAQARRLQPEAALVALATLGKHEDGAKVRTSLQDLGFDEVILKPITSENAGLLGERWCSEWEQLVTTRDDLIEVSRLHYRQGQRDRYLHELATRFEASLRGQSDACYDQVIVDLSRAEQLAPAEAAEAIARADNVAGSLGVSLQVVLAPRLCASLRAFKDSFSEGKFRWFDSVGAARAAAAS